MHVEVRVGQVGQRIRMAASVASRYALGADGVGAAHPGARGSRVTASRYALGAEGGGAARPGAYMCSPRNCARCLLGGVGMSKTSCAARCSRGSVQGVLRAPAEGEGGVAHHENFSAAATATLERSGGTVAHGKRAARERRRRRSKVSRHRRAGRAPPARRGRRVRVPRAFKRPAKTLWWWWGGWWWQQLRITSGWLPRSGEVFNIIIGLPTRWGPCRSTGQRGSPMNMTPSRPPGSLPRPPKFAKPSR